MALAAIAALSGCVTDPAPTDLAVASYPAAFLAETLGGPDVSVADLGSRVPLHDFEPTSRDLARLRHADHLVLWGDTIEAWAHRASDSLGRSAPPVFELTTDAPDNADGHEAGDHDDPHTWTDPLTMRAAATRLADQLAQWYPQRAANITARAATLEARLDDLDAAFTDGLADCTHDTIVTNHAAHGPLAARYGFHILSLHGIAPGAEPSPATVRDVIQTIRDLALPVLFIEEGTSPAAVAAIQDETGVEVRILATLEQRPAQGDYIDEQYRNLQQLRFALACP